MIKLTEEEIDLIEAIRNFKNSQHNPSFELEAYIYEILDRMIH